MTARIALLVAAALLAPPARTQAQDGDIVVRARKLREWRAVLLIGADDRVTCRIVRSTGDAALDARACAAQQRCYDTARPAILAVGQVPAARRRRALAAVNRDIATCFGTVSRHIAAYPLED